jgi:anti-anti-sigma regulatory factor
MIPRGLLEGIGFVAFLAMLVMSSIAILYGLVRLVHRERRRIRSLHSLLNSLSSVHKTAKRVDVLRAGSGAVVTVPGAMDPEDARAARSTLSQLLSAELTHMVLVVDGSAVDWSPLLGFLTDADVTCGLFGVRLSIMTSDRDIARVLRESCCGDRTQVLHVNATTGRDVEGTGTGRSSGFVSKPASRST